MLGHLGGTIRVHRRRILAASMLALLAAAPASPHPLDASAPIELTSRPVDLAQGIGRETISLPDSGDHPLARKLYAQGLAQLHAYRWIEAARAFHTALRLDADFALAEIGLVRAYEAMKDPERATLHMARARELSRNASTRDAALVEAMTHRHRAHSTGPADRGAHVAYRNALDSLLLAFPEDVEILLLRGNASESFAWGKGMGGTEASLVYYEKAVEIAPQHPGARHYLAHTYENLARHFEAAGEAARFARLAPRAPHARHMYAHTLPRIGKWEKAIEELEVADALEREYFATEGIPAGNDWHRVHNLTILGLAYLRVGRAEDAERVLRESFATPLPDPQTTTWHTIWPEFLLLEERNEEAMAAARSLEKRGNPIAEIVGITLRGEAELNAGDTEKARASLARARRRLATYEQTASAHPMGPALGWVAEDFLELLAARLALRSPGAEQDPGPALRMSKAIASLPNLDGWGAGWLRLLRFERDARATGQLEVADRLATMAGSVPVPDHAKR